MILKLIKSVQKRLYNLISEENLNELHFLTQNLNGSILHSDFRLVFSSVKS